MEGGKMTTSNLEAEGAVLEVDSCSYQFFPKKVIPSTSSSSVQNLTLFSTVSAAASPVLEETDNCPLSDPLVPNLIENSLKMGNSSTLKTNFKRRLLNRYLANEMLLKKIKNLAEKRKEKLEYSNLNMELENAPLSKDPLIEVDEGEMRADQQPTVERSPPPLLTNCRQPSEDEDCYILRILPINQQQEATKKPEFQLQPSSLPCQNSQMSSSNCSVIARNTDIHMHGIKVINHIIGRDLHLNQEYYLKCGACEFTISTKQFGGSPTENEGYLSHEVALVDMKIHVVRKHTEFEPRRREKSLATIWINSLKKYENRNSKSSASRDRLRSSKYYWNLPYKTCDTCGKSYKRLAVHMRTHNNPEPEPCYLCGQTFSTKTDLKLHMSKCSWYTCLGDAETNSSCGTSQSNNQETSTPIGDEDGLIARRNCTASETETSSSSESAPEQHPIQHPNCDEDEDDLDILFVKSSGEKLTCNGVDVFLCTSSSNKKYLQCSICSYITPATSLIEGLEVYQLEDMDTHTLNCHSDSISSGDHNQFIIRSDWNIPNNKK